MILTLHRCYSDNGLQFFRESDYFFSDVFLNSYISVDTFFLVSGLLVSYSFFKVRMQCNSVDLCALIKMGCREARREGAKSPLDFRKFTAIRSMRTLPTSGPCTTCIGGSGSTHFQPSQVWHSLRLTPAYVLFIGLFVAWTPQMHGIWATSTAQVYISRP